MGRIPDETIREVIARTDIVELIGRYLPLKASGSSFLGLCPFHKEKTPSFNVNPDKQMFYCFGCQEGGNAIGFLMNVEGQTFPDAVRTLAERAGVQIKEDRKDADPGGADRRANAAQAVKEAQRFYHERLMHNRQGEAAREYLSGRNIDGVTMELFGMGYAPDGWDHLANHLRNKGFNPHTLLDAGLVKEGQRGLYDAYRDRVTFPIANVAGEPLGFGGRALAEGEKSGPKYINSPQTLLYNKSYHCYGLSNAKASIREKERAIVVEGYLDCIRLHQHGFKEAVASLGTALTEDQIRLVSRFSKNIYLLFDSDAAGQRAMLRVLPPFLKLDMMPRVILLPEGVKDPDELMDQGEEGEKALVKAIKEAAPLMDLFIETVWSKSARDVMMKKELTDAILPLLASTPSAVLREHYLTKLEGITGVGVKSLASEMRKRVPNAPTPYPNEAPPPAEDVTPVQTPLLPPEEEWSRSIKIEMELLGLFIYDLDIAMEMLEYDIEPFFRNRATLELLHCVKMMVSRGSRVTSDAVIEALPDQRATAYLMRRLVDGYYAQIADGPDGLTVWMVRTLGKMMVECFNDMARHPKARENLMLFRELRLQRDHCRKWIEGRSGHDLKALLPQFNEYISESSEMVSRMEFSLIDAVSHNSEV